MEDKRLIREKILRNLNSIDKVEHRERSIKLAEKLFLLPEWKNAKVIGITLARHPEIETETIILQAKKENKTVLIPKTYYPSRKMEFKKMDSIHPLVKTKFGILEPNELAETVAKNEIDLLIVPGVAFNKDHYRIGFGGGFYDRFLTDFEGSTVSLYLYEQKMEFMPESHDKPVSILIEG
ncbi:5-formyltetrahydrofolate cyclo-ligase [Listeria swaminathanii]|uniref:5-formyltetrahydrofolate cyclo-ligase n=1 Tax=Listeria swaminathanii TaxID=2713501 RepID=A0ABU2IBN5_9LIST|nr:5-formyltetrahydrofolate cyclo-ligase [Listeria swaminathanii]MDT0016617.1 5-formyltetrahydrofolate cyclo-ligase [Listeria swaminathanii]MDT0022053.1 5-formyltetrahydrofolate cyclo-ligase [Listeria swaminathanii]MDT0033017.1 5-formyltetrahydrofolate cyclo-ligase [Listeria swaminathanii]MDT0051133.1 5-formyltetrahydrofolate cyclo-ligase [Listeria swaminathanii]MDT0053898.1 5-formyltetrahydrofolate cyclo-ligase [Listeria swaminathanii]